MVAYLRKNSVEIRHRLASVGMRLCKCSEFDGAEWLEYTDGCYYEIHGVGYVNDEFPSKERNLERFLRDMELEVEKGNDVFDFGEDEESFVKFCKKWKDESKEQNHIL